MESRVLLAWGTDPQLIDQDLMTATYPQANGAGQVIVVIDSGVNASHPSLVGKLWTNPGEIAGDGIDNDHDGYVDDVHGYDFVRNDSNPDDEAGHGTAVAGLIVASPFTYNSATYAGVAPAARVIALKVLDQTGGYAPGAEKRIEKALQWVEAMNKRYRISAVNMSFYTPADVYAATYSDEVKRLAAAGVVLSASGGQDNPNADAHFPSADPLVFATTVVDTSDHLSTIVNRGPMIDLLAPGKNPVLLARSGSGFVIGAEGSSYAAPHTTAAAALLRQIDPKFTAAQVMSILQDSGVSVTDTSTQYTYSGRTYPRLDLDDALALAYARRNGGGAGTPTQTPFKGTPFATDAPIQAEDFDNGGEGVAFHDATSPNLGGAAYRPSSVDVGATADVGGGYAVTYATAGEWLQYTVDVATAGLYTFNARVASPRAGARFHAEVDGVDVTGALAVPVTADWTAYTTLSRSGINLAAGRHVLRVRMDANNAWGYSGNFNWFSLTHRDPGIS